MGDLAQGVGTRKGKVKSQLSRKPLLPNRQSRAVMSKPCLANKIDGLAYAVKCLQQNSSSEGQILQTQFPEAPLQECYRRFLFFKV
jgi:hypothetical protein